MNRISLAFGCWLLIGFTLSCSDITRRKEAVLKDNLQTMRSLIQQFTLDKQRAPQALKELIAAGYLREIPTDITGSRETWVEERESVLLSVAEKQLGIVDVHSGSEEVSSEGTRYNSW